MTLTFSFSEEAEEIGMELVQEHHQDLIGIEVRYVFRSKAAKSAGKVVWGRCRKISGLNAFLAMGPEPDEDDAGGDFYVIELAEDVWAELSHEERVALVDHELCHTKVDMDEATGEITLHTQGHDVEEFACIVERHGLWRRDVEFFAVKCAASQPQLFEGAGT